MRILLVRLLGVVVLLGLILFAIRVVAPRIEASLAQQAKAVAASNGADWATITADGRDILVSGRPDSAEAGEVLRSKIEEIIGVRSVRFLEQAMPEQSGRSESTAFFRATRDPATSRIAIEGIVSSSYQAPTEVGELSIDSGELERQATAFAGEPDIYTSALESAADLKEGTVEIRSDRIIISSTSLDDATREAIQRRLQPFEALGYELTFQEKNNSSPDTEEGLASSSVAKSPPETDAAAANVVSRESCQNEINQLLKLSGGIRFGNNSADLRDGSRRLLKEVASHLQRCPTTAIQIVGHTDARGSAAANLKLSAKRANAVKAFLAGEGIGGERMTARGAGEREPVASNRTAEGRARNRRIEILLEERKK